ncbi:hypothetical protein [Bifidobacterium sp. SO1]|uniref:hypothetical protein n=1 Tax=Bifidobacterium sp. SO1 TaxID=2809029 RepID=UPI001BDD1D22|nr:hypothetical protein [Bifidobacterium sp. SO1]MBT1162551.1 hypothetical protein [Bifidobacterium sp. SO1]
MTDNPELANSEPIVDPLSWLTGVTGSLGGVFGVLTLIGLIFVILLTVLQCLRFVSDRTKISGTDKEAAKNDKARRKIEEDDLFDDYGETD